MAFDVSRCKMLPYFFMQKIHEARAPIVLFSMVRNEKLRIGPFLRHYRQMGVTQFAIVDNGSEDGTDDLLASEPDVAVTRTLESFAAANFGMNWLNEFLERLETPAWVLFADADELLVYRGWPERPLASLCGEIAAGGNTAALAFMLDMYPDGPLEDAETPPSGSLFETAPCFDRDYHFRLRPQKPWQKPGKSLEVIGGPRVRFLSSFERERRTTWFSYFLRGQLDRILSFTPDKALPWVIRLAPRQLPSLSKIPLVRAGNGISYVNNHTVTGARLHSENLVFCHFKFLKDFADRVAVEAARGEHFRRGAEYIMYADMLRKHKKIDLRYPGSLRFESAQQLVDLGLIRDIRPFMD